MPTFFRVAHEYMGDAGGGVREGVRGMRILVPSQQLLHGLLWEAGVAGDGHPRGKIGARQFSAIR